MASSANSDGHTNSGGQTYGGGCVTRKGMATGVETKRRWTGCARTGNPLPFVTAIVASNPGDSGQGRDWCFNTSASRSFSSASRSFYA
jgi:hypothetical protein